MDIICDQCNLSKNKDDFMCEKIKYFLTLQKYKHFIILL